MLNENEKTYNKGVPTKLEGYIPLRQVDLTNLSNNPEQVSEYISAMHSEILISYMKKLLKCEPNGYIPDLNFFKTLGITFDEQEMKNKIILNPYSIFNSIFHWLNLISNTNSKFNDAPFKLIIKELSSLKNVKSEKELQSKYPVLAKIYFSDMNRKRNILSLTKILKINLRKTNNIIAAKKIANYIGSSVKVSDISREINRIYKYNGLDGFIDLYSSYIELIIKDFENIEKHLINNPLDLTKNLDIDSSVLELYIANSYVTTAEMQQHYSDLEEVQKCLYYLTIYFIENKELLEDDFSIETKSFENIEMQIKFVPGHVISIKDLYKRYKLILSKNPKLKIVDFSWEDFETMNFEEISDFITEFLNESDANWELLPSQDAVEKEIMDIYEREINKSINRPLNKNQKSPDELLELYYQKKKFFDQTDYFKIIKGSKAFMVMLVIFIKMEKLF